MLYIVRRWYMGVVMFKKNKAYLADPFNFFDVLNIFILLIITLACIIPMMHVLFASFSDPVSLAQHEGIILMPLGFYTKGYELVFNDPAIFTGYTNTILIVVVGTFINIIMTLLAGYVTSRRGSVFSKPIMMMITFTMFFNGGLIPFYLTVTSLGFMNSFWSLVIPVALSAYNVIIMRTAIIGVPSALEESAKIDGANDFVILFKVITPVVVPVVAVLILFYAVGHWNSWFNAMLFLNERDRYPLQLILREILLAGDTNTMTAGSSTTATGTTNLHVALLKYCTIIVATVPILCIYPFIQKFFVKGVMVGSIKG